MSNSKYYDLALVFVSFQRCCVYASLLKELSGKYRIALCPQELDAKAYSRTKNTINDFLRLCESLGAEVVFEPIEADVEILPQSNYTKENINKINSMIKSKRTYWLSGLAMGNSYYDFLHGKRVDKILVVDRRFYDYRVKNFESKDDKKFNEDQIIEIGVPYKKYPIIPSLGIDYMWANPTPFSFCGMQDRLDYLENVKSLIDLTEEDDVIALKPHMLMNESTTLSMREFICF